MEPPAQPAVPPTQIPKSKGGCACCAMGCTSMFVLALVGLAMIIGLLWWGLGEVVKEYTASGPIAVATETTDAEYAAAEQKYNALAEAARSRRTVTVQLSASEVNALIARHPEFADMRGKFRVAMADSLMTRRDERAAARDRSAADPRSLAQWLGPFRAPLSRRQFQFLAP